MTMADSQFCLEWDAHNKNICNGLSSLQQSGEFVDMTLAADGHHVRVHQMVMALASPYIKELISSANCPHPVIFLNKISYQTLCSILEYIYTGQTCIGVENISELIVAAKELHIKGLEDVKAAGDTPVSEVNASVEDQPTELPEIQIKLQRHTQKPPQISTLSSLKRKLDTSNAKSPSSMPIRKRPTIISQTDTKSKDMPVLQTDNEPQQGKNLGYDDPLDVDDTDDFNDDDDYAIDNNTSTTVVQKPSADNPQMSVQYTVSNQGSLQLILNRFLYFLYYQYRDKSRQWRCVDNRNSRCNASVFTKDNIVLRRVGAHNHTFHDKNILKKVRAGAVYSALQEAEAKTTRTPRNLRAQRDQPAQRDQRGEHAE